MPRLTLSEGLCAGLAGGAVDGPDLVRVAVVDGLAVGAPPRAAGDDDVAARGALEPDRRRQELVLRQPDDRRQGRALRRRARRRNRDERHARPDQRRHGAAGAGLGPELDEDVVAGPRRERQGRAQRLEALRRLAVDADHIGLEVVEADAGRAGVAEVREAKPQARPRRRLDRVRRRLAGNGEKVADPAARRRLERAAEGRQRPVGIEAPVVEDDDVLAVDRRRGPFLDDEEPGEATLRRLGARARDAGPEEVGAGVGGREAAVEILPRRDRRLRQPADAVHGVRDAHAVPVQRQRRRRAVLEPDPHLLAMPHAQGRPRHGAVEGPQLGLRRRVGVKLHLERRRRKDAEPVLLGRHGLRRGAPERNEARRKPGGDGAAGQSHAAL